MIPAPLNLLVTQGADLELTLTLLSGERIRVVDTALKGALTIPIKPLNQPLASGMRLYFAEYRVVLTADADIGSEFLQVEELKLAIAKNTTGQAVANLSGALAKSQVKQKLSAAAKATFLCTIPDPLEGQIVLFLDHDQTKKLDPTLPPSTVLTDVELQSRKPQNNDYHWDIDVIYNSGKIETPMGGIVVVLPGVTT